MFFLRKSKQAPLPVAMSGVRMGERVLQIGIDDPAVAGALAAKVGLSGHAAMALTGEPDAVKARANLSPEQYAMAVRAHMRGRPISIRGVLVRGPRLSSVVDIGAFEEILGDVQGALPT